MKLLRRKMSLCEENIFINREFILKVLDQDIKNKISEFKEILSKKVLKDGTPFKHALFFDYIVPEVIFLQRSYLAKGNTKYNDLIRELQKVAYDLQFLD